MISNVQFLLLSLLQMEGSLTGYEINKLLKKRGYREWANIGNTSVYNGLSALQKKNWIELRLAQKSSGKGPAPNVATLLPEGEKILKKHCLSVLESLSPPAGSFELAVTCIGFLDSQDATAALKKRAEQLRNQINRVKSQKYEPQGGKKLPLSARLLFEYSFLKMQTQADFCERAANQLNEDFKS